MEQACPQCHTSTYENPQMKLMINDCGHNLCVVCLDKIFTRPSGPCPQCGKPLKRSNYREKQFDSEYIERDVKIRKTVLKDFNKREENFDSLEEYNEYLEMVEDTIFNLVNGINIDDTQKGIERYRKENQDLIYHNRSIQDQEYRETQQKFDIELTKSELRRQERKMEEYREQQRIKQDKERVLQELITGVAHPQSNEESAAPAEEKKVMSESQTINFKMTNFPGQREETYEYVPIRMDLNGPAPPDSEIINTLAYDKHFCTLDTERLAGGFSIGIACQRALQEAFTDLYYNL